MKEYTGIMMVAGSILFLIPVLLLRFGINVGEGEIPDKSMVVAWQHGLQILGLTGFILILSAQIDELKKSK